MHEAGYVFFAGTLIAFAGWVWLVVLLWKESIPMALGALTLFPFLAFWVLMSDWTCAKLPFFIFLGGVAIAGGAVILPASGLW